MEGEKFKEENGEKGEKDRKRAELIEQILAMQQELQALDDRSQKLEYENTFFKKSIGELQDDIEYMKKNPAK